MEMSKELEQQEIHRYWERRWNWMRHLLSPALAEHARSRLFIQIAAPWCEVHIVLMLPTGTLTSRGKGPADEPTVAVDEAAERLILEIRQHTSMLRSDLLYQRCRRRRGDLSGILPVLRERHALRDRASFKSLLEPALRDLTQHARRELVLSQPEGFVGVSECSVSALFSLLVSRAWEQFEHRPAAIGLELWLAKLLHEILDDRTGDRDQSARIAKDTSRRSVSDYERDDSALSPPAESLNLADVVSLQYSKSPWQFGSDEDQRNWILSNLREFPRPMRRAFTLYVLEGWNEEEVARILDCEPESVLRDVQHVRDELSRRLSAPMAEDHGINSFDGQ